MIFISNVGSGVLLLRLQNVKRLGDTSTESMTHELGASEGPEGQGVWKKVETGSDQKQYIYSWDQDGTFYGSEYSQAVSAHLSSTGGFEKGQIVEKRNRQNDTKWSV